MKADHTELFLEAVRGNKPISIERLGYIRAVQKAQNLSMLHPDDSNIKELYEALYNNLPDYEKAYFKQDQKVS